MPTDTDAILSYRAARVKQWKDLVAAYEAYVDWYQITKKQSQTNPPKFQPYQFYAPALSFLDELLTHLPPARASALLEALPEGWAVDPERWLAVYMDVPGVSSFIGESLPTAQWGDGMLGTTDFDDGQAVGMWVLKRLDSELKASKAMVDKALNESLPQFEPPARPPKAAPAAKTTSSVGLWIAGGAAVAAIAALLYLSRPSNR